jgi:hypothetical protein
MTYTHPYTRPFRPRTCTTPTWPARFTLSYPYTRTYTTYTHRDPTRAWGVLSTPSVESPGNYKINRPALRLGLNTQLPPPPTRGYIDETKENAMNEQERLATYEARNIWKAAHDKWLTDNPEMRAIDFACDHCHSMPGTPCAGKPRTESLGGKFHAPRVDMQVHHIMSRSRRAWRAGDAAVSEAARAGGAVMTDPYQQAFEQARDAYLAAHPEPTELDFVCPRLNAQPVEPCRWRRTPSLQGQSHLARQDRYSRAFMERQRVANDAGYAAEGALVEAGRRRR